MSVEDIKSNADNVIKSLEFSVQKLKKTLEGRKTPDYLQDYEIKIAESRGLLSDVKFKEELRTPAIATALEDFVAITRELRDCFKEEAYPDLEDRLRAIGYHLGDLNAAKENLENLRPGHVFTATGNQALRAIQNNAPMGPLPEGRIHARATMNRAEYGFQNNSLLTADPARVLEVSVSFLGAQQMTDRMDTD